MRICPKRLKAQQLTQGAPVLQGRQDEQVRHQDQEPARGAGNRRQRSLEQRAGILLEHQRQQDERNQHGYRQKGDMGVYIEPEPGPVGVSGLPALGVVLERGRGRDLQPDETLSLPDGPCSGLLFDAFELPGSSVSPDQ